MYNPLEVCPSPAASSPQTGNKNLHVRTMYRKITTYTSCVSLYPTDCPVIFLHQLLLQRACIYQPRSVHCWRFCCSSPAPPTSGGGCRFSKIHPLTIFTGFIFFLQTDIKFKTMHCATTLMSITSTPVHPTLNLYKLCNNTNVSLTILSI